MIVIFSYLNDTSTTDVIRWIKSISDKEVVRLNEDALADGSARIQFDNSSFYIQIGEARISCRDISAIWFRKGNLWLESLFSPVEIASHPALTKKLNDRFLVEDRKMKEYFHYLANENCRVLGNPFISNPNKLIVMHKASQVGLDVPEFVVSNSHSDLLNWIDSGGGNVVTKAISDGLYLWDFDGTRRGYFSYTERMGLGQVGYESDERLAPSLVQREIVKDYEVRAFYLDGAFFAMAIFSQLDLTTSVDYRKYNYEVPNRMVPYNIPAEVESKLRMLFENLELNTGSADLIVDSNGKYIFLEINPTGQYMALSQICNYQIDQCIAKWLVN